MNLKLIKMNIKYEYTGVIQRINKKKGEKRGKSVNTKLYFFMIL